MLSVPAYEDVLQCYGQGTHSGAPQQVHFEVLIPTAVVPQPEAGFHSEVSFA